MLRDERILGRLPPRTFPLSDQKRSGKACKFIDDTFGMPGISFEVICTALGGLRYYDLEISLKDGIHAYNLCIANSSSFTLKEGFRAQNIVNHTRFREATRTYENYPMVA